MKEAVEKVSDVTLTEEVSINSTSGEGSGGFSVEDCIQQAKVSINSTSGEGSGSPKKERK